MRCALASLLVLTGRATEAMAEAQTVLTNSGVPADLRDQLRQMFRKLDIRSRVDLARIALEHARPEATQTP